MVHPTPLNLVSPVHSLNILLTPEIPPGLFIEVPSKHTSWSADDLENIFVTSLRLFILQLMKDTSLTQAIVEKIMLKKNLVKDYVFNRIRGAWMLREVREMAISENMNASFLDFYQRFVSDMAFQKKSLNSRVIFVGPDPDDDFSVMEGIITPDTWEAFAPQLPSKLLYNIIYGQPEPVGNEKIFVMRGVANGLEMELRFKKVNNRWLLMKMTT